ncbi:MAG: DUF4231 domain-containing protein [Gammaproteobacteria bacterium]|nr:DUF4231 domain-containing protein [Gammaproteobacteria bacterium]
MPRRSRWRNSFFNNEQLRVLNKLDEKIELYQEKYKSALRAALVLRISQTIAAAFVPVFALLDKDVTAYPAAILGAIIVALNGIEQKTSFAKDAGKYKAHYESLLQERDEYIKKQGPYLSLRKSEMVRQLDWRTDNVNLAEIRETEVGFETPPSSDSPPTDLNHHLAHRLPV